MRATVPLRPMNRVIAYFVALVLSAVAVGVGIQVVAANTSALDRFKGGAGTTTTTVDIGPAPPAGQTFVRGTIDKLTAEGAQGAPSLIPAPFTLNAVDRGVGRATIENALVAGKRTTIVWGGGTPLPISGTGGALDLAGAKVDVDASGATWTVDGGARVLKPGAYRAGAPVAVGATGVAAPRDSVDFTADAQTTISARSGVVVKIAPAPMELTGPGKVTATGQLQVRDQKTLMPAAGVDLGEGPYTVKLNPVAGHVDLDAVLQGTVTRR